jgi:hypothetical protein
MMEALVGWVICLFFCPRKKKTMPFFSYCIFAMIVCKIV